MKVRDRKLRRDVDVADRRCPGASCYWPRPDPGVFTQGSGYSSRPGGGRGWLCGTREIHGCPYTVVCPDPACGRMHPLYETKCRACGRPLKTEMSLSQKEFSSMKRRLTSVVNKLKAAKEGRKDPDIVRCADAVIAEADRATRVFDEKGYPDSHHNWERAKDDAVLAKRLAGGGEQ